MLNFNEDFLSRMNNILGEDFPKFLESLNQPIQKSVYVNQNKIAVEDFKRIIDFSVEPIDYEPAGFYVDNEKRGRHALHHAGAFYMQEPSAMFTINSFKFNGDERVLDMCASPGGKTIQIANRIPNGMLVSNEFVKSRSAVLYSNVERMGLKNVIITNEDPKNLARAYGNCFDVCVVDAPCSGEGMFRRGEEVVEQWNSSMPQMCAKRQLEILDSADKTLKQGGYLIYSTCTYSLEENEYVVKNFMKEYGYEIINITAPFSRGIGLDEAVRLYPHIVKGEGQFVALLKKISENLNEQNSSFELKDCKISCDFIKKYTNFDKKLQNFQNFSYYIPDVSLIKKGINYVSVGVRAGEVKQGRFEPNHYLFTAFGNNFNIKLNLDYRDNNVLKYLKGETLETELDDGYGAVLVNGCALGGFKISKQKFKNHYPKGLRNFK